MPILYKYPERVMFAHIPKTAGTAIYAWFSDNGWIVSNLKLNSPGSKDIFMHQYGIFQCQMEGPQEQGIPPQHATASTYARWGEFTSGFTIVRHPLCRFISEIGYHYKILCLQKKIINPDKKKAIIFAEEFTNHVLHEYNIKNNVRDNHIRPQTDFISDITDILYFEKNWTEYLAQKYQLKGSPPKLNVNAQKYNFSYLLTSETKQKIINFYAQDFTTFGYTSFE
jgi:hypothetical protein